MKFNKDLKKYEQLRDYLIDFIKKNNLTTNDKLPTINEIISKTKFSYATVNRTLIEMENEGLITKHQGKGLFVNKIEPTKKTKQIALIIPAHFSDHKIFMEILSGVRNTLEKAGIGLLVSISNMSHQKEKETIDMLISKSIDGIIIFMEDNYRDDFSHIAELKKRNFPFVLVDRYVPELDTDYVVVNNKNAMIKIASYLKYNKNCEQLYFVPDFTSRDSISSSEEKVEGLTEAYQLLFGRQCNCVLTCKDLLEKTDELSLLNKNVGIIFNHDALVTDYILKLKKQNKNVPNNFSLFGYNNSGKINFPTVEQFNQQVGAKAAEILISKLDNATDLKTQQIKIEPKLVIPEDNGSFRMEA